MKFPPRNFDNFASPFAQYLFNNSLADSSGNGYALSTLGGTARYAPVMPGLNGLLCDGSSVFGRSIGNSGPFRIFGDMSGHFIMSHVLTSYPSANVGIIGTWTQGETQATNSAWLIRFNANNPQLEYSHEYGAGVDQNLTSSSLGAIRGLPQLFSFTRESNVVKLFINAELKATSPTLTTPDGATDSLLVIAGLTGTSRWQGVLGPTQFHDFAMSQDQITELWNRSLGRSLGYK